MIKSLAKIHILSGVPASGKTTFRNAALKEGNGKVSYVSSDEIRSELLERKKYQHPLSRSDWNKLNTEVFKTMFDRTIELVVKSVEDSSFILEDILYDSTNLSFRRRINLYNEINKALAKRNIKTDIEIDFFHVPMQEALKRNSSRDQHNFVPEEIICDMYAQHQPPIIGLDCDSYVYHGEKYFRGVKVTVCNDISSMIKQIENSVLYHEVFPVLNTPHHSEPHHLETVEEHINLVLDKVTNSDDEMKFLALFHDLGKPVTKVQSFERNARYVGHANVGSVYAFIAKESSVGDFNGDTMDSLIKVIQLHMLQHEGISKKVRNRYKLTEHEISLLERLAIADSQGRVIDYNYSTK